MSCEIADQSTPNLVMTYVVMVPVGSYDINTSKRPIKSMVRITKSLFGRRVVVGELRTPEVVQHESMMRVYKFTSRSLFRV